MSNKERSLEEKREYRDPYRENLSTWISSLSIIGVLIMTFAMIAAAFVRSDPETMKMVFTAALPLFGAWVGTILAFYYGKANYEAATRSFTSIAETVSPMEKLKSIAVTSKMRALKDMVVEKRPIDQIKLTEILDTLKDKQRLPILDDNGAVIYMVHRSAIDRFIASEALKATPTDLKNLMFKDLLERDKELKSQFERSFGVVNQDATLANVKILMENLPNCQDVFVTKTGKITEPILGWVTNNALQEAARV